MGNEGKETITQSAPSKQDAFKERDESHDQDQRQPWTMTDHRGSVHIETLRELLGVMMVVM